MNQKEVEEIELDYCRGVEHQNNWLRERGLLERRSVDTFFSDVSGFWKVQVSSPFFSAFPIRSWTFTEFFGDIIDEGNNSWVISGTAVGKKNDGTPTTWVYNLEYKSPTDTLDWWLSGSKSTIANISAANGPVQMSADVTVPRVLLVARSDIYFDYGLRLLTSSYFQLG